MFAFPFFLSLPRWTRWYIFIPRLLWSLPVHVLKICGFQNFGDDACGSYLCDIYVSSITWYWQSIVIITKYLEILIFGLFFQEKKKRRKTEQHRSFISFILIFQNILFQNGSPTCAPEIVRKLISLFFSRGRSWWGNSIVLRSRHVMMIIYHLLIITHFDHPPVYVWYGW